MSCHVIRVRVGVNPMRAEHTEKSSEEAVAEGQGGGRGGEELGGGCWRRTRRGEEGGKSLEEAVGEKLGLGSGVVRVRVRPQGDWVRLDPSGLPLTLSWVGLGPGLVRVRVRVS